MKLEKLPCKLDNTEVRLKGEELALARKEHHELADAAKASAARFKTSIKEVDERIDDLAEQVRTRQETRDVEIIDVKDMDRQMVDTIRTDTGEVVRSRAMTLNERQIHLFEPGVRLVDDLDDETEDETEDDLATTAPAS